MKKLVAIIPIIVFVLGIVLVNIYNNNIKNSSIEKPKIIIKNKEENKGIFNDYYKDAEEIVKKMTIKEKVGQLFLVRYNKDDVEYLSNFYPGGYILFAKDLANHTKESIKEEIDKDQSLNKYPLIIGVDEEGGFVTRVSRYPAFREEKFLSPKSY